MAAMRLRAAVLALTLLVPARAAADDPAGGDRIAPPNRKVHIPITVVVAAAYFTAEVPLKAPLSADECSWCSPILFDASVRDGLVWEDVHRARSLSNITGYAGAAIWAAGGIGLAAHLDERGLGNWLDDALIIAEAAAFTGLLNYTAKALTARERPFVHALPPEEKPFTSAPQDNNQSFYSGHSALSMSLAISAGKVAQLRGYSIAPYLYAGGISLSLATGYLRIAGDKHWSTDVLTGWLLGAAIGYALPVFFHSHRHDDISITPVVSASTVGVAVQW
jgi:membrane-associated phospholipid phosphatase